jgi:hypothetical protein
MDISRINHLNKTILSSSNKIDRDYGFQKIFDRKLNDIGATDASMMVENKTGVLERGEKILNLLDQYTKVLSDPTKTLKEIETIVKCLETEAGQFETEGIDEVHQDRELGKLINDIAVTTNVAVMKFNRGDFIKT